MSKPINNPGNDSYKTDKEACPACRDLLINIERLFDTLHDVRKIPLSDWLTVDDIALELKISKSIVYRLIRNGELEAVNIAETKGHIAQRGHYRIKRTSLDDYLESKKVKTPPDKIRNSSHTWRFPNVKNHLGI